MIFFFKGIDFNKTGERSDWLTLALFDDCTFDDYQGKEWIDKLTDEDGSSRIITGKGLRLD